MSGNTIVAVIVVHEEFETHRTLVIPAQPQAAVSILLVKIQSLPVTEGCTTALTRMLDLELPSAMSHAVVSLPCRMGLECCKAVGGRTHFEILQAMSLVGFAVGAMLLELRFVLEEQSASLLTSALDLSVRLKNSQKLGDPTSSASPCHNAG